MIPNGLIEALQMCADENDEHECVSCCYFKQGCMSKMMHDSVNTIEKLQAEVEQWKQAWKTAYKLYDDLRKEKNNEQKRV